MLSCYELSAGIRIFEEISVFSEGNADPETVELLDLCHNSIQSLSSFPDMPALMELVLSSNRITAILPRQLPRLDSVTRLDLSCNMISEFSGLGLLPSLTELDLSCNRISALRDFQAFLDSRLSSLILSGNSVADLRQLLYLTGLKRLKKLSFIDRNQSNPISNLKGYTVTVLQTVPMIAELDGHLISDQARRFAATRPSLLVEGDCTETQNSPGFSNPMTPVISGLKDLQTVSPPTNEKTVAPLAKDASTDNLSRHNLTLTSFPSAKFHELPQINAILKSHEDKEASLQKHLEDAKAQVAAEASKVKHLKEAVGLLQNKLSEEESKRAEQLLRFKASVEEAQAYFKDREREWSYKHEEAKKHHEEDMEKQRVAHADAIAKLTESSAATIIDYRTSTDRLNVKVESIRKELQSAEFKMKSAISEMTANFSVERAAFEKTILGLGAEFDSSKAASKETIAERIRQAREQDACTIQAQEDELAKLRGQVSHLNEVLLETATKSASEQYRAGNEQQRAHQLQLLLQDKDVEIQRLKDELIRSQDSQSIAEVQFTEKEKRFSDLEHACKSELSRMFCQLKEAKRAAALAEEGSTMAVATCTEARAAATEANRSMEEANAKLQVVEKDLFAKEQIIYLMKSDAEKSKKDLIQLVLRCEATVKSKLAVEADFASAKSEAEKVVLELQGDKAKLKSELEVTRNALDAVRLTETSAHAKVAELQDRLIMLQDSEGKQLQVVAAEKGRIIAELEELKIRSQTKDSILKDLSEQLVSLKAQLSTVQDETAAKQKKRDADWQAVVEEEGRRLSRAGQQVDELERVLSEKEERIECMVQRLAEQDKSWQYMHEELEDMRTQWDEQQRVLTEKESGIGDVVKGKDAEITSLQKDLTVMQSDLRALRIEKVDLQGQIQEASRKVAKTESDMRALLIEFEKRNSRAKERMNQVTSLLQNFN